MTGLEEYLKFTMKTQEEFEDGWLPNLGSKQVVSDNNMIIYKFYEKPQIQTLSSTNAQLWQNPQFDQ